jgi:hypothetical protein
MKKSFVKPGSIAKTFEVSDHNVEILAYIQSNKFITTKLFHRKFYPNHKYWTACFYLRDLVEKGLLLKMQKLPNEETFFCLTRPALHLLVSQARILISPEVRSPRINPFEREHDKRVLAMRIQIEEAGGLEGLTWLSDYEMRCGLKMEWKKALVQGQGWDLAGSKLHRVHGRTPDAYFEAQSEGNPCGFALEYENTLYSRKKIGDMVLNLAMDFPKAYKLIVSKDRDHAIRMFHGLKDFVKTHTQGRGLWGLSFFDQVVNLPFTRTPWVNLAGGYLPFVKDPILKKDNPQAKPGDQTTKEIA